MAGAGCAWAQPLCVGWVARGTLWLGESEQARKEGGAERDREERESELVSARRATHRLNKCAAADWDEDHWGEEAHVREGRGQHTVAVCLNHAQNHLWREVWPAAPCEGARGAYWHLVKKQVGALFAGGGGGMQAAGDAAAAYAAAEATAQGLTGAKVATEAKKARKAAMGALRAATSMPVAKEHLYQVGEYQLQDCLLSEPFEVRVALVLAAYVCFARSTGCRPGMAVNVKTDEADPDGPWFETPPLKMSSLQISPDALRMLIEGQLFTIMEIKFTRKKGENFACYDFGTVLTPDSDEMVRLGTVAMLRLLLAAASFRACYAELDQAAAAALRAEVADPEGFVGLDWRCTGYGSLLELIGACRRDGWVLDQAARGRPLFPSVDEKAGRFDFSESFDCRWPHV